MEVIRIKMKNIKVICGFLCTLSLMLIFIQNINIKELYVMLSHTNIKVLDRSFPLSHHEAAAHQGAHHGPAEGIGGDVGLKGIRFDGGGNVGPGEFLQVTDGDGRQRRQIGRASCRERV